MLTAGKSLRITAQAVQAARVVQEVQVVPGHIHLLLVRHMAAEAGNFNCIISSPLIEIICDFYNDVWYTIGNDKESYDSMAFS